MNKPTYVKITLTTPRNERVVLVVWEDLPERMRGLYYEFSLPDGRVICVSGETKLAELVLHMFDYAVPEGWAKDYQRKHVMWPSGVWCYDREMGCSPIFGDFVSRDRIMKLAGEKIVDAYLKEKQHV
jgi:hypothetical protein